LFEQYYWARIINTTSLKTGGLLSPKSLVIDEARQYVVWSEPKNGELRFARYVTTISDDIEGRGIAWNGHTPNPADEYKSVTSLPDPYLWSPVHMMFDNGFGPARWGNTAECYGNGRCLGLEGNWVCDCYNGYEGDCQKISCPKGRAWWNEPIVDNIAHDIYVECSGIGTCDYLTGTCKCKYGYEGSACQRSSCPGDSRLGLVCNGKDRCVSMRQLGQHHLNSDGSPSPVYYGSNPNDPLTWDADMIYGCLPDEYGWYETGQYNITSGSNNLANEYHCPVGFNRRLSDNIHQQANFSSLFTIQQVVCSAFKGYFQFDFRGSLTTPIYANASETKLKNILQNVPAIGQVKISMSHDRLCSDTERYHTNITFLHQLGSLPLLKVVNNNLRGFENRVTVELIQQGSDKSLMECSGHGECNRRTGECKCWKDYGPSDGLGNQGTHNDCGYYFTG
jgi:hypothetical protein